jgi:hypothetical protein
MHAQSVKMHLMECRTHAFAIALSGAGLVKIHLKEMQDTCWIHKKKSRHPVQCACCLHHLLVPICTVPRRAATQHHRAFTNMVEDSVVGFFH